MNWSNKWAIFVQKMQVEKYRELIYEGLYTTIKIAVLGLIIGIVIGTIIAAIKVAPKYKFILRLMEKICDIYMAFFRGTPIMVQLLLAWYILLPMLGIQIEKNIVGIWVFGFNSGAYVSEIMRSGLNSVDKGQMEAGRALGLNYVQTMFKIVIPQAVKNILPTLGNEFIQLIKETSVLSFITITDLYKALKDIAMANQQYEVVIPYLLLGIMYIALVLLITLLVKVLEKLLAKSDRKVEKRVKKSNPDKKRG
jgi:polar amino acid transport system permease protein